MRTIKKILALLITAVVAVSFLACTSQSVSVKPDSLNTQSKSNESQSSRGNVESNLESRKENKQRITLERVEPEVVSGGYYFSEKEKLGIFGYSNKCGCISPTGKVIIEPKYESIKSFSEGYAIAIPNISEDKVVIIDENGTETPVDQSLRGTFEDEMDTVEGNNHRGNFHEGVAFLMSKAKQAYVAINTKGQYLFTAPFDCSIGCFDNGIAVGVKDSIDQKGNIIAIDKTGKQIFKLPCLSKDANYCSWPDFSFSDGLLTFPNDKGLWGAVDQKGNVVIDFKYESLTRASDGLIGFMKYGKYGYMDYQANVKIQPSYEFATAFSDKLAAVKQNGMYGYIDTNGHMVINPSYKDAGPFYKSGLAVVASGDKNVGSLIDTQGNKLLSATDGNCIYVQEGSWGLDYFGGNMVAVEGDHSLYKINIG